MMSAIASRITGVPIVYSNVCSGTDKKKIQSSASQALVRGIHRWTANSKHQGPVTRKLFPFDDVIMIMCSTGMKGHKGPKGHKGHQGHPGLKGHQGTGGPPGMQGEEGVRGMTQ